MTTRVLAFFTHPDDLEFMAGGTLALLARAGCEIHLATMAGGEVGSLTEDAQQIRARRTAEAAAAGAVIGARYHYAGGHDLQIQYDEYHRRLAVRVMRQVDPDLVITHPPADYLLDHEQTSLLVRTAAFIASVPHYDCGLPLPPTRKIPHLYYSDATGLVDPLGQPLPLHLAVDIAEVIQTQQQMLACHQSQRDWLRHINGTDDFLAQAAERAGEQGRRHGLTYAEGFIQHLGFGHPQDDLLAALLPGHAHQLPGRPRR